MPHSCTCWCCPCLAPCNRDLSDSQFSSLDRQAETQVNHFDWKYVKGKPATNVSAERLKCLPMLDKCGKAYNIKGCMCSLPATHGRLSPLIGPNGVERYDVCNFISDGPSNGLLLCQSEVILY